MLEFMKNIRVRDKNTNNIKKMTDIIKIGTSLQDSGLLQKGYSNN